MNREDGDKIVENPAWRDALYELQFRYADGTFHPLIFPIRGNEFAGGITAVGNLIPIPQFITMRDLHAQISLTNKPEETKVK
jgi:hypothetical protein